MVVPQSVTSFAVAIVRFECMWCAGACMLACGCCFSLCPQYEPMVCVAYCCFSSCLIGLCCSSMFMYILLALNIRWYAWFMFLPYVYMFCVGL